MSLSSIKDRLEALGQVFAYPAEPHCRRHGPRGYTTLESYRDWLRDEFSYRCAFSLVRETWPGTMFHIDHVMPQRDRPDLIYNYDNLILITAQMNLRKGRKQLPDLTQVALGKCLRVVDSGAKAGEIEGLQTPGPELIKTLRLNSDKAVEERRKWIGILYAVAHTDEALFRELIGYPADLPNLSRKQVESNDRPAGVAQSAWHRRNINRELPEYF